MIPLPGAHRARDCAPDKALILSQPRLQPQRDKTHEQLSSVSMASPYSSETCKWLFWSWTQLGSICQPNNSSRAETSCWSKQAKLASAILRHNHECFHVVRFALIRLYDAWDGYEPFKWLVQALHLNWTQFKVSPVRFLAATSDPVIVKLCTIQPRHSRHQWSDDELIILINLMERTIFLLSINDLLLKFLPFFAK